MLPWSHVQIKDFIDSGIWVDGAQLQMAGAHLVLDQRRVADFLVADEKLDPSRSEADGDVAARWWRERGWRC